MKKVIVLAMLTFPSYTFADRKDSLLNTFIGIETSLDKNFPDNQNETESYKQNFRLGQCFGVTLRQELNVNFSVSTGLIYKRYQTEFWNDSIPNKIIIAERNEKQFTTWQIPFNLNTLANLYKNRIFIKLNIGYNLGFVVPHDSSTGLIPHADYWGTRLQPYYYDAQKKSMAFGLAESGLGLLIKTGTKFEFAFNANYYHPFKDLIVFKNPRDNTTYSNHRGAVFRLNIQFYYSFLKSKSFLQNSKVESEPFY